MLLNFFVQVKQSIFIAKVNQNNSETQTHRLQSYKIEVVLESCIWPVCAPSE